MLRMVKNLIRFRLGQKVARGTAKKLGLGPVAGIVGLVSGLRAMRKH